MTLPLILRHRPIDFDAVRGNEAVIAALQRRITAEGYPHAFLLTGPSGVGKTTVARIIARYFNAEIIEVDAASNNGIDAMRALVDSGDYRRPGADLTSVLIILDECHRLTGNAWDAVLKTIEEPPEHLFWGLCTTEFGRVPKTIVTRCYHVKLERLTDQQIEEYLLDILVAEGWESVCNPDVFRLICQEAQGSPRMALTLLDACYDAPSLEEAERIVTLQSSPGALLQIVNMLIKRQGGWGSIQPLLAHMDDSDFSEGAVIGACRYICGALDRERDQDKARLLWELLSSFTYPASGHDTKTLVYTAIGRILWSQV